MDRLGRFEILEEIGRGGCGIVYRAVDPRIGRQVAIKTILSGSIPGTTATVRPKSISPDQPTGTIRTAEDSLYQRLQLEAQSAGRLAHPNIVTIVPLVGISYAF